jgi:hypothetical protein
MINRVGERIHEFIKVLFVQEYLMLFISESILFKTFLAFRDRQVVIIGSSRFHIKKVRSLSGLYFGREYFIPPVCLIFFHNPSNFKVRFKFGPD